MKKIFTIVSCFLAMSVVCCTNEVDTVRTLENSGYSDIKTDGWSAYGCAKDDTYSTKFSAKNPAGKYVNGTVCCGVFKSCTVRF